MACVYNGPSLFNLHCVLLYLVCVAMSSLNDLNFTTSPLRTISPPPTDEPTPWRALALRANCSSEEVVRFRFNGKKAASLCVRWWGRSLEANTPTTTGTSTEPPFHPPGQLSAQPQQVVSPADCPNRRTADRGTYGARDYRAATAPAASLPKERHQQTWSHCGHGRPPWPTECRFLSAHTHLLSRGVKRLLSYIMMRATRQWYRLARRQPLRWHPSRSHAPCPP